MKTQYIDRGSNRQDPLYVRNKKTLNFWISKSKATWDVDQNSKIILTQATLIHSLAILAQAPLSEAKHMLSTRQRYRYMYHSNNTNKKLYTNSCSKHMLFILN